MIHRLLLLALMGAVFAGGFGVAQDADKGDKTEEPLRLKRKKKPDEPGMVEPMKQPGEKDKQPEPMDKLKQKEPAVVDPVTTEENEKELLERIGKNMRKVEDQLLNKELGESTLQLEDDIIKDLEALIKKTENDNNGGGGGGENNQDMNQQGQQGQQPQGGQSQGQKQKQQGKGSRGQKQQGDQQKQQGQNQGQNQPMNQGQGMNMGMNMGQGGNNPGMGGANDPNNPPDRNADLYKDIWGHLPETVRAQMNAFAGKEEYMQKHRDLIKQYYRSLAEQEKK